MFKLIAIADLHIKRTPGVCWGWNSARYRRFIDDLVKKCVKEDAILVIAGDTLNSTDPKKEEIQIFMYFLHQLYQNNITTLLVSGNHEGLKRKSSILDFMEVSKFKNVVYRSSFVKEGVTFDLVNHDMIQDHSPTLGNGLNVLVSHFRSNYNKFVTEEINVGEFTKPYDLCIVGDIHSEYQFGNVVYTNNPVNCEFGSSPICGYLEIIFDGKDISVVRVNTDYPRLLGRKIKASEYSSQAITTTDYFRFDIEGTPEELKDIPESANNVLINKVPVVNSVYIEPEEIEEMGNTGCADSDLINYMKMLKYEEDDISDMLYELRRQL